MDAASWRGRRVLVTGHTGFKGAWLSLWLEHLGAVVTGLALAPESPNGVFGAVGAWKSLDDRRGELRDPSVVAAVVEEANPEVILHLGAQSLVRRGYAEPVATFETNVMGTAHVLQAASAAPALRAIVVVTSDKVYANSGGEQPFREGDPLGHTDPYSSSKACAELLTTSWRASYLDAAGVRVSTARAGNVIGGGDVAEDRLVPDALRALAADETLLIRNPSASRPWQHVLEPVGGYLELAEALCAGEAPPALNFGPGDDSCRPVADVVEMVFELWGAGRWALHDGTHPKEAHVLRLDSSLAQERIGWRPRLDLRTALEWTVEWEQARLRGEDMREMTLGQIDRYQALGASA